MTDPIDREPKPDAVGELRYPDLVVRWAVYPQMIVRLTALHRPDLQVPIRIRCRFEHEGESFEVLGQYFMDPINFARLTPETWNEKVLETAKLLVRKAQEEQARLGPVMLVVDRGVMN